MTVFQVVKNPGAPDNFTFTVDGSLRNMTLYVTGASSLTFSLSSPTGVILQMLHLPDQKSLVFVSSVSGNTFASPPGVSQSSSESSGPLASLTTAGNLRRLSLNTDNQTGSWQISVNSNSPYSVKVTGQSQF